MGLAAAACKEVPEIVVLSQELSQARTQLVPWSLAQASLADRPVATMSPPFKPCVTGKRPLWKAILRVCSLLKQPLAYPHAISPARDLLCMPFGSPLTGKVREQQVMDMMSKLLFSKQQKRYS